MWQLVSNTLVRIDNDIIIPTWYYIAVISSDVYHWLCNITRQRAPQDTLVLESTGLMLRCVSLRVLSCGMRFGAVSAYEMQRASAVGGSRTIWDKCHSFHGTFFWLIIVKGNDPKIWKLPQRCRKFSVLLLRAHWQQGSLLTSVWRQKSGKLMPS